MKGKTLEKIEFEFQDNNGTPIDLSNTTINCQFRHKRKTGKVVVDLSLGKGLTLAGSGSNIVEIDQILALDWAVDLYFYDIKIFFIATSKTKVYVEGTMLIVQNVTE